MQLDNLTFKAQAALQEAQHVAHRYSQQLTLDIWTSPPNNTWRATATTLNSARGRWSERSRKNSSTRFPSDYSRANSTGDTIKVTAKGDALLLDTKG